MTARTPCRSTSTRRPEPTLSPTPLVSDPGLHRETARASARIASFAETRFARSRDPPGCRFAVRSIGLRVRVRPGKDESGTGLGRAGSPVHSFVVINQYQGDFQCLV